MKKLTKTYKNIIIRPNDFDSKDFIRPSAILDYFQTIATIHAEEIGLGYEEMKNKGLAWILAKQKYVVYDNTNMYDTFDALTYPLPVKGLAYDRYYELKSAKTSFLVKGLSRWCVADINTHQITRKQLSYNGECIDDAGGIDFDKDLVKISDIEGFTKKCEYLVQNSDLDHYHHMNNTKYGDVILNAIDKEYKIKELEIIYSHECKCEDVIEAYTKEDNNIIFVLGLIKDTNNICFKAKLIINK